MPTKAKKSAEDREGDEYRKYPQRRKRLCQVIHNNKDSPRKVVLGLFIPGFFLSPPSFVREGKRKTKEKSSKKTKRKFL